VREWYFHIIKGPKYFEKFLYIDSINVYNSVIEEFSKLYDKTPPSDRFARATILSGMRKSKRELAKTQAKYEIFKKYKTRTAISK